jgi:NAD(P)-dependent dehydrogenase (short-subunit alcohol dehydrogenase family)
MSNTAGQPTLKDKSIVIIGGTSGIGLSAAKALISAGAKVVAVGRPDETTESAASSLGPDAVVVAADATQPNTTPNAIQTAVKHYGGFHGLYHVAGGSGRTWGDGPLHSIPDLAWQKTLDLNLTSVFLSNRSAIQFWLDGKQPGSIINLASVLATSPAPTHFTTHAYATAKAGIIGLTRSCAACYATNNIRLNAIAPGLVNTPMAQRAAQNPAIQHFIHTKQPLDGGRIASPQDLDGATVFLLSDAAAFITGQILQIDGGWSLSDGQIQPEA